MGGCFQCFGSANEEQNGEKEGEKKDSAKEGSASQSNRVNRVSSGNSSSFRSGFLIFLCGCKLNFICVFSVLGLLRRVNAVEIWVCICSFD